MFLVPLEAVNFCHLCERVNFIILGALKYFNRMLQASLWLNGKIQLGKQRQQ